MSRCIQRQEDGFTLIEVMISLSVLLIGIVGILALHLGLTRESNFSRHTVEASVVGEFKMEELFAIPEAMMAAGSDTVDSRGVDVSAGFTRTWTIDRSAVTTSTITVDVTWDERGDDYTITLTSMRSIE